MPLLIVQFVIDVGEVKWETRILSSSMRHVLRLSLGPDIESLVGSL